MSFRAVCRRGSAHDTVLIYGGPDPDHRALLGTMNMRREESIAFWRWIGGVRTIGDTLLDYEVEVPRG